MSRTQVTSSVDRAFLAASELDTIVSEVTTCLPGWVVDAPVVVQYGSWKWTHDDRVVKLTTWPGLLVGYFALAYDEGGVEKSYLTLSSLKQVRLWLAVFGL